MTKKLVAISLAIALVITLGLAPVAYAAKPVPEELDKVDIGSGTPRDLALSPDWGPIEPTMHPGSWGGIGSETPPGTCRVVWHEGDPTPRYATLTLDTDGAGKARHIVLRVLDGIADDSFNVHVMNPGGDWTEVYRYSADPSIDEVWKVHHIYSFPAGKGQGPSIEMKIEATGPAWDSFGTFGQLAVDWVEVWTH